ncbi:MAG: hypothetical protein KDK64_00415 [Chlamydiia bacterium]|nr:hypothetical protein [Chlamydiia bacterium]
MSGVSGVNSSGSLPPMEPPSTNVNADSAIDFFHDQYADQLASIAKENALQRSQ